MNYLVKMLERDKKALEKEKKEENEHKKRDRGREYQGKDEREGKKVRLEDGDH